MKCLEIVLTEVILFKSWNLLNLVDIHEDVKCIIKTIDN